MAKNITTWAEFHKEFHASGKQVLKIKNIQTATDNANPTFNFYTLDAETGKHEQISIACGKTALIAVATEHKSARPALDLGDIFAHAKAGHLVFEWNSQWYGVDFNNDLTDYVDVKGKIKNDDSDDDVKVKDKIKK